MLPPKHDLLNKINHSVKMTAVRKNLDFKS